MDVYLSILHNFGVSPALFHCQKMNGAVRNPVCPVCTLLLGNVQISVACTCSQMQEHQLADWSKTFHQQRNPRCIYFLRLSRLGRLPITTHHPTHQPSLYTLPTPSRRNPLITAPATRQTTYHHPSPLLNPPNWRKDYSLRKIR